MKQNLKAQVLDHGFVRLVESMGSDLSVVRSARVSYNAQWRTGKDAGKDEKLINYLMIHRHTSPFEMVQFTFEVKAPIFVFRQWHRHRTWSYNEVSARYSELPEEFYLPRPEHIGTQSKDNKQVRDLGKPEDHKRFIEIMRVTNTIAFDRYRSLLGQGVPRELARSVLPLATYTHMFASVDLHNLFHFLRLRLHTHAQYEIQQYAVAILRLIYNTVPVSTKAFLRHRINYLDVCRGAQNFKESVLGHHEN